MRLQTFISIFIFFDVNETNQMRIAECSYKWFCARHSWDHRKWWNMINWIISVSRTICIWRSQRIASYSKSSCQKSIRSSVYIIFRNKFSSSTCPSKVSVWAEKLVQRFLAHIQSNVWIKCHNSAINWMKCNEKDELIEKIWAKKWMHVTYGEWCRLLKNNPFIWQRKAKSYITFINSA